MAIGDWPSAIGDQETQALSPDHHRSLFADRYLRRCVAGIHQSNGPGYQRLRP
jgi:hypothetical protein